MMNAALNTHAAQALSQHLFAMPNIIPNIARSLSTVGATAFAIEAAALGLFGTVALVAGAANPASSRNDKAGQALFMGLGILNVGGAALAGAASWLGYRWVCQSALSADPGVQHLWSFVLLPYAVTSLLAAKRFRDMGQPFIA